MYTLIRFYTQSVIINEFLASNVRDTPEMQDFDDYTDWIELYNSSSEQVVLDEIFLTDDLNNPPKMENSKWYIN